MRRDPSLVPLSRQHHNGLALCVLTERSLAAGEGPRTLTQLAARIRDRYEVELANHFSVEEEILFPACPASVAEELEELTGEHRQMEHLVEQLREGPTAALVRKFIGLLRQHIRREERGLFEQVPALIPPEALAALGREIDEKAVQICL